MRGGRERVYREWGLVAGFEAGGAAIVVAAGVVATGVVAGVTGVITGIR